MRFVLLLAATLAGASALGACAASSAEEDDYWLGSDEVPVDPYDEPPPEFVPSAEQDAGAFSVPERPRADGGSKAPADAGASAPDAAPTPACPGLAAGSLVIVELLIKSVDGAGDGAEWVELKNPNDCVLTVPPGLRVLSPRGTTSHDVATVTTAFELPPQAQFVAGGSGAPVHADWPTIRWSSADTLKNSGDTVRIELGETATPLLVDAVVYPAFSNLTAARSIAFPSDCPPPARASFSNWSGSFADYPPGPLVGTPFTPNDDVTCAPMP